MPLSGLAIASVGVGGVVLYSGWTGATLADTFTSLLKGKAPSDTEPITAASYPSASGTDTEEPGTPLGNTGASSGDAAQNQATAKSILDSMGLSSWTTGQEWDDLVSLWNQESGWSDTVTNSSSGAAGIAQNINGWSSDYQEGNATSQIEWGISYIEQRYGSPVMAWAHEVSNDWY